MARPRLTPGQAVRMLGTGSGVDISDLVRDRRSRPRPRTQAGSGRPTPPKPGQNICPGARRILGLDLAHTTGWALLVDGQPAAHGTFVMPDRSKNEKLAHWHGRQAARLSEYVRLLVSVHRPDVLAYEYPDGYRRAWSGGSKGREFVVAAGLGRLQGFLVALWPSIGGDARLVAVSTTDAKLTATGRVDANKAQVRWSLQTGRGFDFTGWTDDETDAASIAVAAREGAG
jgi:hypothetical protein